jgi:hypothetical protein
MTPAQRRALLLIGVAILIGIAAAVLTWSLLRRLSSR